MHFSLLAQGLLVTGVTAARGRRIRRQDGPTDPGIPSDCTYWDTAINEKYDCGFFESDWGLTHEQFVEYVSHSYYVEVNNRFPRDDDPRKNPAVEEDYSGL
ncbi:hypothetical protein B0J15DRAFT_468111 [Fusarium solani]|uniref:Uncharacterized protein n=1 Tax=Fusarium solani TaxID=169388 RepID=A0A9P9H3A9_FUSSL|nr:uncharacterized protein B0J15DRAFT_468111 [Fusarium solani]KAH7249578.1 hypothetical protein B0J15DRAFT_468111 [Fusarium solani]